MGGPANREHLQWPLRLAQERCAGVFVLVAAGRLSHASAGAFRSALDEAVSRERGGLVVDLGRVDYVSSAGLVAIEGAAARLAEARGVLALCDLSEPVRIALDLAGLLSRLVVEPTREDAARRIASHADADGERR